MEEEKKDNMSSDDELNNFISKFINSQESLGQPFTDILYDNLWDLYQE